MTQRSPCKSSLARGVPSVGQSQNNTISKLLSTTPQLWKGRRSKHAQRALPTGDAKLDARLPGHGWPLGAVTELISAKPGLGELSLLFSTLGGMSEQGQWIIMIDPPWIPYPASLHGHGLLLEQLLLVRTQQEKDSLWACEQALNGGRSGAVLAWPERISFTRLRRLQLAAESSSKLAFLFRPQNALNTASPAALRLQLEAGGQRGTRISVLKCRGSKPLEPTWIPQPYCQAPSRHIPNSQLPDATTQPLSGTIQAPAPATIN
jgi:cell division inhibitor SulA